MWSRRMQQVILLSGMDCVIFEYFHLKVFFSFIDNR